MKITKNYNKQHIIYGYFSVFMKNTIFLIFSDIPWVFRIHRIHDVYESNSVKKLLENKNIIRGM